MLSLLITLGLSASVQHARSPVAASLVRVPLAEAGTTAITSTGLALSVTRASTRNCTYSDGGMFSVPSGQPCVDGNGLFVEPQRVNLGLQSEDWSSSTWVKGSGVVVTADQATSPRADVTADAVDFTAAAANQTVYQRFASSLSSSTTYTASVWVWVGSGTGSFEISRTNTTTWASATLSPVLTATTMPQRFSLTYTTGAGETSSDINIGGEGKTPYSASNVKFFMWGFQHEQASAASSYCGPSTGTSVQCNADKVDYSNGSSVFLGVTPCMAATVRIAGYPASNLALILSPWNGATDRWQLQLNSAGAVTCQFNNGIGYAVDSSNPVPLNTATRVVCGYTGTQLRLAVGSTVSTANQVVTPSASFAKVGIGYEPTGGLYPINGEISNVTIGRNAWGCQ